MRQIVTNALACMPIAIGVDGVAHFVVRGGVIQ